MSESWIKTIELCRYYQRGPSVVRAIDGVNLTVAKGEFLGLVGSSGSGKSTLLNLIAGLDTPTSGDIEVEGISLTSLSRHELASYRAHKVGMVFQAFNLLPHRTALGNVEMALYFDDTPPKERRRKAEAILERLGLSDRMDHNPADLSGGEQQRVAIARALVKEPEILFADEPTGNLDHDNARQISDLLADLNRQGLTVILVTHDRELAGQYTGRTVHLHYGKLVEDTANPLKPEAEQ